MAHLHPSIVWAFTRLGTKKDLNTFEMLFYNSAISCVVMLPLALYTGDLAELFSGGEEHTPSFWLLFGLSSLMGFFFNLVVFKCTQVNSALATSITGNLKDCLATMLGQAAAAVRACIRRCSSAPRPLPARRPPLRGLVARCAIFV